LATSELKILKLLAAIEITLELNNIADFEDESTITILEQLSILSERVDEITVYKESIKDPKPNNNLDSYQ
jgi:hypothetical protein